MNLRNPELNGAYSLESSHEEDSTADRENAASSFIYVRCANCLGVSKPVFYELSSRLRYPLLVRRPGSG